MIRSLLLLLLLLSLGTPLRAQGNIALADSKRNADSTLTAHISVGLASNVDTLSGLQLNVIANNARRLLRGAQMSFISNFAERVQGMQLSTFSNLAGQPLEGLQLSSATNIAGGVRRGMQFSGFANVSGGVMRGLQLGSYNHADTLNGVQLGLFNVAISHPRGWQIGLVNYSRDTLNHKVGLVNINPRTRIDLLAFLGNTSIFNFGVRFRNRHTYTLVGAGTHYMGLDHKFSGALFYRLGRYLQLSPRWTLSGDLGYYHIETFQENSRTKPERLFSLQAHVNADYQVNRRLGVFASVGYGDTRYYGHHRRYKHGWIGQVGLSVNWHRSGEKQPRLRRYRPHQVTDIVYDYAQLDSISRRFAYNDPRYSRPRFWKAALETTGINVFVHCFDRFVLNADYAQVHFYDIKNNLKNAFVWDNDQFSTNLFAHPYHGNLYFNAARSSGLSFWQSAPYAFGGSLMWELCGENEPPAINDLIATSIGGMCIGEVMHRVSALVLNDRSHGFRRFLREAAATVINPMQGLNRICTGQAWRVKDSHYLYHDYHRFPVDFSLSLGLRYLADDGGMFRGETNPYLNFFLEYGDPFNEEENRPYDFFSAEATFGLSANQPLINGLHLLGRLWGAPVYTGKHVKTEFGIYQHFNYYDSKPVKNGTDLTPYRISEAAAFGPGFIFSFPRYGVFDRLEQRVFLSGILLGGTKSDYYNVIDRDYNMGSGYSLKSKTHMEFRRFGRLIMHADYYRIYTWKGYEDKDLSTVDPLFVNAQGDRGNAALLVVNPSWEFDFKGSLSMELSASYFSRVTHYKYHDTVRAKTFEVKLGVRVHF